MRPASRQPPAVVPLQGFEDDEVDDRALARATYRPDVTEIVIYKFEFEPKTYSPEVSNP